MACCLPFFRKKNLDMMEKLMKDDAMWQEYSAAAKEIAKGYSWKDIAERIVELYGV